MQHFAGACASGDTRTAIPKTFLAYYPGLIEQSTLNEAVHFCGSASKSFAVGHPPQYEAVGPRDHYETENAVDLGAFGLTIMRPLGDIALARSGDKGANINIGIFVRREEEWDWLRSFLNVAQMKALMGHDWHPTFHVERIEFEHLRAVHFVIYGPLGRGVSSSSRLDSLGKAFGEYIRDRHIPIPVKFLA
ncbi:MAG: hypothetical protein M1818_003019 [Claussenomyces sp. TS43310]|nr:MAG: hypothetical protein M1818_003019 [Claussenomyces sp. TS43310]